MNARPAHPILVLSANWQTRALLTAQLGETSDRDIVSAPGVNDALGLIKIAGINPALLVVDAGRADERGWTTSLEDVERLMVAQPETPLVLSVSALCRATFDPLRERCAAYLVRPVSIGKIAQVAIRLLNR